MPIALLCFVMAVWQALPPANENSKKRRLDIPGLVTFAFMLSSFLLLVDLGGSDRELNSRMIPVLAGVLGVSAISFVLVEHFWAANPMIPPSLVTQGGVWAYLVVQVFLLGAQFTVSQ